MGPGLCLLPADLERALSIFREILIKIAKIGSTLRVNAGDDAVYAFRGLTGRPAADLIRIRDHLQDPAETCNEARRQSVDPGPRRPGRNGHMISDTHPYLSGLG